jgi:hypothetical protein
MENVFRQGQSGRLEPSDLIKKNYNGVSQSIANGFWNITTNLPKRIVLTLKNATGNLVASTTIKYAIYEYKSGNPYNFEWMKLVSAGGFTTDANGVLDVLYTGEVAVGGTAYVAVIHPDTTPTESLIWNVTVQ